MPQTVAYGSAGGTDQMSPMDDRAKVEVIIRHDALMIVGGKAKAGSAVSAAFVIRETASFVEWRSIRIPRTKAHIEGTPWSPAEPLLESPLPEPNRLG
jgi:hypothetical protein